MEMLKAQLLSRLWVVLLDLQSSCPASAMRVVFTHRVIQVLSL